MCELIQRHHTYTNSDNNITTIERNADMYLHTNMIFQ